MWNYNFSVYPYVPYVCDTVPLFFAGFMHRSPLLILISVGEVGGSSARSNFRVLVSTLCNLSYFLLLIFVVVSHGCSQCISVLFNLYRGTLKRVLTGEMFSFCRCFVRSENKCTS